MVDSRFLNACFCLTVNVYTGLYTVCVVFLHSFSVVVSIIIRCYYHCSEFSVASLLLQYSSITFSPFFPLHSFISLFDAIQFDVFRIFHCIMLNTKHNKLLLYIRVHLRFSYIHNLQS